MALDFWAYWALTPPPPEKPETFVRWYPGLRVQNGLVLVSKQNAQAGKGSLASFEIVQHTVVLGKRVVYAGK